MYEAVVFDVDGTLIDTEKAILCSLQRTLKEEMNREYPLAELTFVLGIPGTASLQQLGVRNVDGLLHKWDLYMRDFCDEIHVFTGIEPVLNELRRLGIKTGIVTSKTRQELIADLSPFQLARFFSYTVCADDTRKHKPEPEPLLKLMEVADIRPERAVYIGDTLYDLQTAQGAGVDSGLALWGANNKVMPGAKYRFGSPNEILSIITGDRK